MSTEEKAKKATLNHADIRIRLIALMAAEDLSGAKFAKLINVSGAAISTYKNDKYEGDNEVLGQKILDLLQDREESQNCETLMPVIPKYIETPTSKRIYAALAYAHRSQDMTVIYGGAGLGKTKTIEHYIHEHNGFQIWHVEFSAGSNSVRASLHLLAEACGISITRSSSYDLVEERICDRIRDTKGIFILDESQHLKIKTLEIIRAIHDKTGVAIALVGNETIYTQMTGGTRSAEFAQLFSRIGCRVPLMFKPKKEDVYAIANAWGITDKERLEILVNVGCQLGGLRVMVKVLNNAVWSNSGNADVPASYIVKSYQELVGGSLQGAA